MKQFKIFLAIFLSISISRIIPHPPNFTLLIALSFYAPFFLGLRSIPLIIISFAITDFFIGYHNLTHWTWGSIFLIGLLSYFFTNSFISRISGALTGTVVFFIITNFGVWADGRYGYNFKGLVECYVLAIPFFKNNFLSTILFSIIIELTNAYLKIKPKNFFKKN